MWQVRPGVADFLREQGIVEMAGAAEPVRGAAGGGDGRDDGSGDGDAEVHMMLNFWKIYIKKERQDRKRHYNDALIFVVYSTILLLVVFSNMPLSTTFLRHQDGLADLLLDEEFADEEVGNHKKSWYDVMTPEELWQWVEGPLHNAFYPEGGDVSPQPLLWSNELIGRMQLRQVRVMPTKCPDKDWAPFTYRNKTSASMPHAERACAGAYSESRQAEYTTKDEAHAAFETHRTQWAKAGDLNTASDAWDGAAEWYDDWGSGWIVEGQSKLKSSAAFVSSFIGYTDAGNYGEHGYELTLSRNRFHWEEQVRLAKGEFACVNPATGQVDSAPDPALDRQTQCVSSCAGGSACWVQHRPFLDKYTRIFAVTFNLYNGNDFDKDDYSTNTDVSDTNHLDDHLVYAQARFQ